ncbi:hypothetical protein RhiirC2_743507 [Rhizophagus irregularis]|uniref:Uncharacterized protein n=1 Tax=Rhizophagus irregularis TaxID=588596 RepID=A0A2N1NDR6_9GLOM|nr:hypothetical protein RhiirC2_743507 [Rhizophagus irregularis]
MSFLYRKQYPTDTPSLPTSSLLILLLLLWPLRSVLLNTDKVSSVRFPKIVV